MAARQVSGLPSGLSIATVGDTEQLDLLIRLGYLNHTHVAILRSQGICSCSDLAAAVKPQAARKPLSDLLGVEAEKLARTAAAARLLNLKGPGSLYIRELVLGGITKVLPFNEPNIIDSLLYDDQHNIVKFFTILADPDAIARLRGTSRRNWLSNELRHLCVLLAVIVLCMVVLIVRERQWLFPSVSTDDPVTLITNAYFRANAISLLGAKVLMGLGGLGLIWPLFTVSELIAKQLQIWAERRYLSAVDQFIILDALCTLSGREQQLGGLAGTNLPAAYIVSILLVGAISVFRPEIHVKPWYGYATTVFMAGWLTAASVAMRIAFRRLSRLAPWSAASEARYARYHLVQLAVACFVYIPLIFGVLVLVVQLTTGPIVDIISKHFASDLAVFTADIRGITTAPNGHPQWDMEQANLLEWGRNSLDLTLNSLQAIRDLGSRLLSPLTQAILAGMLGCALVLIIIQYLYMNRAKGVLAACAWASLILVGERLPEPVTQKVLGLPINTLRGLLGVLAVAAVISILSELWGAAATTKGTRACANPKCPVAYLPVYSDDDAVCSKCGEALNGHS